MIKKSSSFIGKRTILAAAVAAGALCLGSRVASADTIDVNSIGTPFLTAGGTEAVYTYDITFDSKTIAETPSDGFGVTNFGLGVVSATLAPALSLPGDLPTETTLVSDFSPALTPTDLKDLSGFVSNNGTVSSYNINGTTQTASDLNIGDVEFLDNTAYTASTDENLILTVVTTNTNGYGALGAGVGIDHSGALGSLAYSVTTVLAPYQVPNLGTPPSSPLPLSSLGGGLLFGLAGMMRFLKPRLAR